MNYWDDMCNKYGFGDGAAVPPDASARREVYLRAINHIAAQLGSAFRMTVYDRPGLHNWCLLQTVSVALFDKMDDAARYQHGKDYGIGGPDGAGDDRLWAAVGEAHDLPLDDVVDVYSLIKHDELQKLLEDQDKPAPKGARCDTGMR